jgi:putative ABC transport system permease protein
MIVLTVSLGVASVVAAGSLIESTLASLQRTGQAAAGFADLRIANGFSGIPGDLLETVSAVEGVAAAGAIVTATARTHLDGDPTEFLIVAVDLLGDDPVHGEAFSRNDILVGDETAFLVRLDSVALPREFARKHGLRVGSTIRANLQSGFRPLYVAAMLEPSRLDALFGGAVAVMDLPAAQVLLGRENLVDAIDVRVAPGASAERVRGRLETLVFGRGTVTAVGSESSEWKSLLFNVQLLMGLTGAVALVVGILVIYHGVAVSVSRRVPQLEVVRALGASQRSLLLLLSGEALIVGLAGVVLGALAGGALAWVSASLFMGSVATLYSPVAASSFRLSTGYLALGSSLGIAVAWLASIGTIRGVALSSRELLVASPSRERWRRARRLAAWGAGALAAGLFLPHLEQPTLEAEILIGLVVVSDALVLAGIGLLTPVAVLSVSPVGERLLRASRFVLLRLAWQGLIADPGRSAAIVTAVLLGTGYVVHTLGVVGTLREGVLRWLSDTQHADLMVTGSGSIGLVPSSPAIPLDLAQTIAAQPGVQAVEPLSLVAQPYEDRWIVVAARNPDALGNRLPMGVVAGDLATARLAMSRGEGAIVSEHLATKHALHPGDAIELRTPTGLARFRIEAVVRDYTGGDLGTVFVAPAVFRQRWRNETATAFNVWLRPKTSIDHIRVSLSDALANRCECSVLSRDELHGRSILVVNSIFYTAYALELVAAFVMVVAITGFFTMTLAERRREIKLLRTLGATREQLLRSFVWEASIIALIGGTLGCATGVFLSHRLTETAMRSGVGLVMNYVLPSQVIAVTLGAALVIGVLAAVGPIRSAVVQGLEENAERSDA